MRSHIWSIVVLLVCVIIERGLSPGLVAGIISGVLLVIAVVNAVGVFSYRRINYELQKRKVKPKTVIERDSVTLETGVTKLQSDNVIQLSFRDKVIYTFNKNNNKISSDEERFRDRLKVDEQTGSLTVKDIRREDAGVYKVKISSSSRVKSFLQFINGGGPTYSQINVIVKVKKVENGSVTLHTGVTARQSDDVIQWRFGKTLIAEFNKNNKISTYDGVLDGRFRDKLKRNWIGDLTIRDLRTEHTGLYKLKVISSRGTSCSQIEVIVKDVMTAVELGDSVTLHTGVTEIQTDDKIQWTFGYEETLIVQLIVGSEPSFCDFEDERFRDRLKLNPQTGDLTIKDIRAGCTGFYQVQIHSRRRETEYIGYKVAIFVYSFREESVTLHTESEVQRGSEIQWISDDKTILVTGKNGHKYTNDERFRGKLKMNPHTGDLTITDIRCRDRGIYRFQQIKSDGTISYRIFSVWVREEGIRSVELGGSVTLHTKVTEIQTNNKIEWTLTNENLPIAQMTVGSEPSYNSTDERFRNKLKMNPQTGDLTITNITTELTGVYAVVIYSRRKEREIGIYIVASLVYANKGEPVTLYTESEIQSGSCWMLNDIFRLVKNRDNGEIKYTDDERFKGRLKMNHETGDLTITHIREVDTGVYKFQQISSDENTSCRIFRVCIRGTEENESTTVLMPLLNEADVV